MNYASQVNHLAVKWNLVPTKREEKDGTKRDREGDGTRKEEKLRSKRWTGTTQRNAEGPACPGNKIPSHARPHCISPLLLHSTPLRTPNRIESHARPPLPLPFPSTPSSPPCISSLPHRLLRSTMEMRWAPEQRPRAPRRPADQPSFSSTLLDAICDSMDGPEARRAAPARSAGNACSASRTTASGGKKQQERDAALHCYYYKPALASSYRAREPRTPSAATAATDCSGRGYFSSSEAEYSLRRLRPIRTSVGLAPTHAAPEKMARTTKKPTAATRGCSRPASPGARLASLLNSIFSGKRHSAVRTTPDDQEPTCSTAPSYARSCLSKKTPPPASRSRSTRTVKFLDIDGEVAVAAAAVGRCRRIPVVEVVEEELLRPLDVEVGMGSGEKSSGASSDLFELENLGAIAPESGFLSDRDGSYGDELPVYGSTGAVGLRRDIAHPRLYDYGPYGGLSRSCRKVDFK
uniref:Uncharacterized protein n=1 Tax=Avena sativa TaxID=4498 RepID=A0ACD5W1W8_AVESA